MQETGSFHIFKCCSIKLKDKRKFQGNEIHYILYIEKWRKESTNVVIKGTSELPSIAKFFVRINKR